MIVKFVIVFKLDGLDEEGVIEELKKDGITVNEITDDSLRGSGEPVRLFYCEGSMGAHMKVKLKWNLAAVQDYVYFPMRNHVEWLKVVTKGL